MTRKHPTNKEITDILNDRTLEYSVELYKGIMKEYSKKIPLDRNIVFRSLFEALYKYGLHISIKNKDEFYKVFEKVKRNKIKLDIDAIKLELNIKGKYSNVYISKMMHTIDNSNPIVDRNILNVFGINQIDYKKLCKKYKKFLKTKKAAEILTLFNKKYPNCNISDTKKIDFVLWMYGGKL